MARISRVEKEKNKQRLDGIILDIFLQDGYSGILYERISILSAMKISTIQGYYPSRECFLEALQGRVMPIFIDYLQLDAGREEFIRSWESALQEIVFCNIMKMLFVHIAEDQPSLLAVNAVERFRALVELKLGAEALADVDMLVGRSLLHMLHSEPA
ncbi:hypothetical protein [Psychromonas ossibalaenae]|uniref:hypothetical protein n=1 Tax=Psychromonas ossibalaenae TaxID=444922 RepID=UPI00036DAE9D|nr:hypothetical protein [Psychromonas ossibalaenae]